MLIARRYLVGVLTFAPSLSAQPALLPRVGSAPKSASLLAAGSPSQAQPIGGHTRNESTSSAGSNGSSGGGSRAEGVTVGAGTGSRQRQVSIGELEGAEGKSPLIITLPEVRSQSWRFGVLGPLTFVRFLDRVSICWMAKAAAACKYSAARRDRGACVAACLRSVW